MLHQKATHTITESGNRGRGEKEGDRSFERENDMTEAVSISNPIMYIYIDL